VYELVDYIPNLNPSIQKIDAKNMYWSVDEKKGLYLGNSCDDITESFPDFIFETVSLDIDFEKKPIYIFKCILPQTKKEVEVITSYKKSISLNYLKQRGRIEVKDETDLYVISSLKYTARPGKCSLCGMMHSSGYINYCCDECYFILKKEIKQRGFADLPALSKQSLAIASVFGGEDPKTCAMCGNKKAADDSDICLDCGFMLINSINYTNIYNN